MSHAKKTMQSGFTLIELLLAMAFIAMLLLAIATTILQITRTYNTGLTLKEVNQTSRTILDYLQRDIGASPPFSLTTTVQNPRYIASVTEGAYTGRLCLGQYSYIWNYGRGLVSSNVDIAKYSGTTNKDKIRFVRIPDADASYCTLQANDKYKDVDPTLANELLSGTDHDLVLHWFRIDTNETSAKDPLTQQQMYRVSFTLGTNNQDQAGNGALLIEKQTIGGQQVSVVTGCKPPNVAGSDLEYCAVEQFGLVARAQNAVK